MKVIVCIKQVLDIIGIPQLKINEAAMDIVQDGLWLVVNPADLCALEEALRLKEELHEGKVTVITLGPARAEAALRHCIAKGADHAVHLCDSAFEGSDSYTTAIALSQAIRSMEFDLILCGSQSLDGGSGQVASILAELLGLPQVLAISQLEVHPDCRMAKVHRKLPRGNREVVDCLLPAVFSVEAGINKPRSHSVQAHLKALKREIQVLDLNSLGLRQSDVGREGSLIKVVSIAPPRPRPKKVFIPDSALSAAERLQLLMSGGIVQKSDRQLLEGDPDKLATDVIHFLKDHGVIDTKANY